MQSCALELSDHPQAGRLVRHSCQSYSEAGRAIQHVDDSLSATRQRHAQRSTVFQNRIYYKNGELPDVTADWPSYDLEPQDAIKLTDPRVF